MLTPEIVRALAVLELKAGASAEDIRQAYREQVKVWHPDRFATDPSESLRKKAEEKTKAINEAYACLKQSLCASAYKASHEEKQTPGPLKKCRLPVVEVASPVTGLRLSQACEVNMDDVVIKLRELGVVSWAEGSFAALAKSLEPETAQRVAQELGYELKIKEVTTRSPDHYESPRAQDSMRRNRARERPMQVINEPPIEDDASPWPEAPFWKPTDVPTLEVVTPDGARRFHSLRDWGMVVTIGRGANCNLSLPNDVKLSEQHCMIERRGDKFFLKDLGSRNGTRLNGERIGPEPFYMIHGDIISAGDSKMILRMGGCNLKGVPLSKTTS